MIPQDISQIFAMSKYYKYYISREIIEMNENSSATSERMSSRYELHTFLNKVQIFWWKFEKIYHFVLTLTNKSFQKYVGDFFKFWGLLTLSELYCSAQIVYAYTLKRFPLVLQSAKKYVFHSMYIVHSRYMKIFSNLEQSVGFNSENFAESKKKM